MMRSRGTSNTLTSPTETRKTEVAMPGGTLAARCYVWLCVGGCVPLSLPPSILSPSSPASSSLSVSLRCCVVDVDGGGSGWVVALQSCSSCRMVSSCKIDFVS